MTNVSREGRGGVLMNRKVSGCMLRCYLDIARLLVVVQLLQQLLSKL